MLCDFLQINKQSQKQTTGESHTAHKIYTHVGSYVKNEFFDKALHLQATNPQVQARFKTTIQSETS